MTRGANFCFVIVEMKRHTHRQMITRRVVITKPHHSQNVNGDSVSLSLLCGFVFVYLNVA